MLQYNIQIKSNRVVATLQIFIFYAILNEEVSESQKAQMSN